MTKTVFSGFYLIQPLQRAQWRSGLSYNPLHRTVFQQPLKLAEQSLLMIINHAVLGGYLHYFLILDVGNDAVFDRFFNHIF
jgi:hypothetical protein